MGCIIPPEKIKEIIDLIKTSDDTSNDCSYVISINSKIKSSLNKNPADYQNYFAGKFEDFKLIVLNNGSCKDVLRDRNKNMADNFLSFEHKSNSQIFYGQLGIAHTVLGNKTTASILNYNTDLENKICVINTYCYNCYTPEEQVSNWELSKIEKDISQMLLKYCVTDFTLFDFSEENEVISKFSKYGQFLIIAKNQN